MLLKGNKLYINNQLTATLKGGMIIYETCYQQEQVPFWVLLALEKIAKITTGKLDANAMVKNGKYDFYTSGIKKFKINTAAFEGPAITIAGNGATVGYMH